MNYAYIRASTWTQALSPDTQLQMILAYCKSIGEEIPQENIFIDKAVTSETPLNRRPSGAALCAALRPGDSVFVLRLDRLFRKAAELEHYLKKWVLNPDGEIYLHLVSQGGSSINGKSATGRLMLRVFAAFAEFELDTLRDRSREALAVKKQKRQRISKDPGAGFRWQQVGRKPDGSKLYIKALDPDEMSKLEAFLKWHEKGMSLDQIAKHCKDANPPITRKLLRLKKVRNELGVIVPKIGKSGSPEEHWIEVPWTRDSIYRGIKAMKAMEEAQRASEMQNPDNLQRGEEPLLPE